MRQTMPHNPTSAVTIASIGGAIVATGMMFVPVGVLDGLMGSNGLSELAPATGASLGDMTRALIAYAAGAVTLGGLTVILLRNDRRDQKMRPSVETPVKSLWQDRADIFKSIAAKMPWHIEDDATHSASDLSRFRSANVDADLPNRRPLLASQDLPDLSFIEQRQGPAIASTERQLVEEDVPPQIARQSLPVADVPPNDLTPNFAVETSTAALVAKFEAAVAARHPKRALLEAEPSGSIAQLPHETTGEGAAPHLDDVTAIAVRRPVLELVASAAVKDDDADSALAAALATLHRMTATAH